MEERLKALESDFNEMQKTLYKMAASLDSISKQISSAVNTKETVIILSEKYKSIDKRITKCEWKREELEKKNNAIENKLSLYAWWITIIALAVPYIIKLILK